MKKNSSKLTTRQLPDNKNKNLDKKKIRLI